jgi:hypothetical protein
VCVTKLPLTSGCGPRGLSPVCGNIFGSQYRVLRAVPSRGGPRSVDRKCAGRNASGVKGLSSEKHTVLWWPSQYTEAKAISTGPRVRVRTAMVGAPRRTLQRRPVGTTGVLDHGMYTRSTAERERSAPGRTNQKRPRSRVSEQGVMSEFKTIPGAEVRCSRSSGEVE